MKRRIVCAVFQVVLLASMFCLAFKLMSIDASTEITRAIVSIRADGSIDPSDAPMSTADNITYTLTDNIIAYCSGGGSIVVLRDNIVIDGNGYMLEAPPGSLMHGIEISERRNVTVRNMKVDGFYTGIHLDNSTFNRISGNNITNCKFSIELDSTPFTISRNSNNRISGNNINDCDYGVWLDSSSNNTISGNNITNTAWGIYLGSWFNDEGLMSPSSTYNIISGNNITNCPLGIRFYYSSFNCIFGNIVIGADIGIILEHDSTRNRISENYIAAKSAGIELAGFEHGYIKIGANWNSILNNQIVGNELGLYLRGASHNIIRGNKIHANLKGVVIDCIIKQATGNILVPCKNNTITKNTIESSNQCGIEARNSAGNVVYHNNFISNLHHVESVNSSDVWDDGYPSGGNYWSEYTLLVDFNGDGIGDIPYVIDESNYDHYPLMQPWNSLPVHNMNTGFGYATIQKAIDAPETENGNVILVEEGIYYENVVMNRSLSFVGENRETTIIDGGRNGVTVNVEANSSSISNFTVRNSGNSGYDCGVSIHSNGNTLSNNIVMDNQNGILINPESNANVLIGNNVKANEVYGIHLWNSDNNILKNNTVTNGYDGIIIEFCSNTTLRNNNVSDNVWNFGVGGEGLPYFINDIDASNKVEGKPVQYLINQANAIVDSTWDVGYLCIVNSTSVTVKDLTLNSPSWHGILFAYTANSLVQNVTISGTSYAVDFVHCSNNIVMNNSISNRNGIRLSNSDNNTIVSNDISRNDMAILLFNSSNNTIMYNRISNNWRGIFLYSFGNKIHHNNFIDNQVQIFTDQITYANTWDDGYPSGGNYWSDYAGVDYYSGRYQNETGSDGIGDTPYVINENNTDRYPLMEPITPTPSVLPIVVDIHPETLNLRSEGKWITAFIELPEEYNVNDVNVSSILLNNTIPAKPKPMHTSDCDNDRTPDLTVKFDRHEVISYILAQTNPKKLCKERSMTITLTITGKFNNGTQFRGSTTIKITMHMPKCSRFTCHHRLLHHFRHDRIPLQRKRLFHRTCVYSSSIIPISSTQSDLHCYLEARLVVFRLDLSSSMPTENR